MPISTRDEAITTKTEVSSTWTTRIVIKTDADVEIFGNLDDTNGFPLTAADGEYNLSDLKPSDRIYVDGTATLNILDQTSQ